MTKRNRRKFPNDNPKRNLWRTRVLRESERKPFIHLEDVTWDNLEEWHKFSRPKQAVRIPTHARYRPVSNPLGFMETARHHTTRARSKSERFMDQYWFVPVKNKTDYIENAYNKRIPPRRSVIYPPFLPKGRPAPKPKTERSCKWCGGPFLAKRVDAKYCKAACQKAARRKAVRGNSQKATYIRRG